MKALRSTKQTGTPALITLTWPVCFDTDLNRQQLAFTVLVLLNVGLSKSVKENYCYENYSFIRLSTISFLMLL